MHATPFLPAPQRIGEADEPPLTVCVFGASLFLTITVEKDNPDDESVDDRDAQIHLHPGGQGFWVARMLRHLGEVPVLVIPLGGEKGRVIETLAPYWGVDLDVVEIDAEPPTYLHDRRTGERVEIARSKPSALNRHELDDLYGRVLERSIECGMVVVTGKHQDHGFPVDAFSRMGADLHSTEVTVIGDLHGEELDGLLEGGPIHTLKVSDEDLIEDGLLPASPSQNERVGALRDLATRGSSNVFLSAAESPTLALIDETVWSATPPTLAPADHRGSGDSMTAGLVAAVSRGLDPEATLRLACAAGAANVTRHGLGNVKPGLVETLAERVEVSRL